VELAGSENKLAESLGHNREIARLLGLVEEGIGNRELELAETGKKLSLTTVSLEKIQKDLLDTINESTQRKNEIEVLSSQLLSEKSEISTLQARLSNATSSLAQCERDLVEARATAKLRKEEIDSLSVQLLKERGQVSSLKHEVDSRSKMKDLEARIAHLEKKYWDTVSQEEGMKKDLEKRQVEKAVENETLKQSVTTLERQISNSDVTQLLKSKDELTTVYLSLKRQYKQKEDELQKTEREKDEFRRRLAIYDHKFEPSAYDKTFGLRGKALTPGRMLD